MVWSSGAAEGEQLGGNAGAKNANVLHFQAVFFDEKAPGSFLQFVDVLVLGRGGDDARIPHVLKVVDGLGEDAHGDDADDLRDGQDEIVIFLGNAIAGDERTRLGADLIGRLDAADDDVGGAHALDVFQRVLHAPFAECHQRDHRRGADDDAEHREHGPHFVQPKAA